LAALLDLYACHKRSGAVTLSVPGEAARERNPDVVFFEQAQPSSGQMPPLLVVEILSPTDSRDQGGPMLARLSSHFARGVKMVWLIDTKQDTVSVFSRTCVPTTCETGMQLDGGDVLPEFRCAVADLLDRSAEPGIDRFLNGASIKDEDIPF
jgi:Uma2 family endonuclease